MGLREEGYFWPEGEQARWRWRLSFLALARTSAWIRCVVEEAVVLRGDGDDDGGDVVGQASVPAMRGRMTTRTRLGVDVETIFASVWSRMLSVSGRRSGFQA